MRSGWEKKSLGEVCALINRGVAPRYVESGGVAVLNQKCVRDHRVAFDIGRRHDAVAKKVDPERFIRVGDVLVNSTGTGTLGRVAQIRSEPPEPTTVDTHVTIVRPEAGRFYPDFFGYMLIQIEDEIARSGEGASGQTELARSTLQNKFSVSFPTSIAEQERIVAILDKAFAGLAAATANAEKNLKNARELFEAQLSLTMAQTAEQYGSRRLADVVTRLTNGYVGPTRNIYLSNGVPYLLARHVRDNQLEFDGKTFVSDAFNEKNKKSKLKAGDVLLVQSGHIGHSAVVGPEHEGHNCHAMIVITPVPDELSGEFLSFYFGSAQMKSKFEEIRSGSTVPHLTCGLVRELMIPLPDITRQQKLVAALKNLESGAFQLASLAVEKLRRLEQLKQSILQKAFSGELTSPPSQAIKEAAE